MANANDTLFNTCGSATATLKDLFDNTPKSFIKSMAETFQTYQRPTGNNAESLQKACESKSQPQASAGHSAAKKQSKTLFDRLLTPDDAPLLTSIIAALEQDFSLNRSSDCLRSLLIGANTVKLIGALERGHYADAERINRMLCSHLDALPKVQAADADAETRPTQTWATTVLKKMNQQEQQAAV
ncbi:hypothetical protein [Acanthopleuribacter pedis]|uniref:Uncharacterized protein n=1 Tax=Acanthopleuribacter pedis TaxID=442870 RepID=A0A8J7Q1V8_9BACT|nr:hypothetical protein [Acanthopleuribacter pedis]MBO1318937.1 hypothetical protein [Acanthopleuribacter pedis]